MFFTPGESLAPCVLLLEQESYLSMYKEGDKNILQTIDPFHLNLNYKIYTTNS